MKNNIQRVFSLFLICGLFMAFSAFRPAAIPGAVTCLPPSVSVTAQGSNYVTFGLETPAPVCEYYYVRKSNNSQSGNMTTSNGTITVGGLSSGSYDFYFRSVCEGNEVSEFVISEIIL